MDWIYHAASLPIGQTDGQKEFEEEIFSIRQKNYKENLLGNWLRGGRAGQNMVIEGVN